MVDPSPNTPEQLKTQTGEERFNRRPPPRGDIRKLPFQRLVREIAQDLKTDSASRATPCWRRRRPTSTASPDGLA